MFFQVKKIDLRDIKKIIFDYYGRDSKIAIIYKDKKLTKRLLIAGESFYLMRELLNCFPANLFEVKFIRKRHIPKKHREFLLNTNILDEKQREELS